MDSKSEIILDLLRKLDGADEETSEAIVKQLGQWDESAPILRESARTAFEHKDNQQLLLAIIGLMGIKQAPDPDTLAKLLISKTSELHTIVRLVTGH